MSDTDGTEVPPGRLTPAKRARTAAQQRAAREATAPPAVEEPPVKAPAKKVTKKLTPAKKAVAPVAPVTPAEASVPAPVEPAAAVAATPPAPPIASTAAPTPPVVPAKKALAPRVVKPKPPAPVVKDDDTGHDETSAASLDKTPAEKSWSTTAAATPAPAETPARPQAVAPVRSPLADLPEPVPGVPITKTHVFGALGFLVLVLLRRKRRKNR